MSTFKKNLLTQIDQNIIETKEGLFVQAGSHQFQSFWTRDFCFASFGLSRAGKHKVVKNHLQKLLDSMNSDGLIPRILESSFSKKTVLLNTVFSFLPANIKKSKHNKKLKAEHFGEHGTLSIDSNALVIIACFEYLKYSGDNEFIENNKEKLKTCFDFYERRTRDALIYQKEFEDWQDSARREGITFYTNLLYFQAGKLLSEREVISFDVVFQEKLIRDTFYRDGLFISIKDKPQIDIASNYLALIFDFVLKEHQKEHFEKINAKEYSSSPFPLCAYPNSAKDQISWTCKYVGLSRYHDEMIWSWIMGLKLKALEKLDDKTNFETYLGAIWELNQKHGSTFEIYSVTTHKPVKNVLYQSESPFSWGIGITLWALE